MAQHDPYDDHDDPAPRSQGRDEMNLAEFPFALLTRQTGEQDSFTYEGWITDRNGRRQKQRWTVRGAGGLGLPTEFDERVVVALMAISADQGFEARKVPFSVYAIVQTMGATRGKRIYQAIERSLERLVGVTIYAEGAFWDQGEKSWMKVKSGFHIIDKFWLAYREEDEGIREAEGVPGYFVWSEDIWKSIQDGYIKYLDLDFYFGLKGPLARRLYRFLDKRMAYQNEYEIDIFDLAGRLGMTRYDYPSKVLEKLKPALEELITRGFLARAEVVKVKKYTRLHFWRAIPALQAEVDGPSTRAAASPSAESEDVLATLRALDLSEAVTRDVVQRYDRARILEKVDYLLWAQETAPDSIRNPQGWLRRAIEENWGPPDGYQSPEAQSAAREAHEALFEEQEAVPSSVEERLHARYGTTERERGQWQAALRSLEGQMTQATYRTLFPHTHLLCVADGTARIGVPNTMVEQWLRHRLARPLQSALEHHVEPGLALEFVLLAPDEW